MTKIKQKDIDELERKIDDISCHIDKESIKINGYISIKAMIEETETLKKYLVSIEKTGSIIM